MTAIQAHSVLLSTVPRRSRLAALVAAFLLVAACGDDSSAAMDAGPLMDSSAPDASTDTGPDAARDAGNDAGTLDGGPSDAGADAPDAASPDVGVDAGSMPCAAEPCRVEWSPGPDLLRPLDHHTTAVLGDEGAKYLTVIGGLNSERGVVTEFSPDIMTAPIGADGSVGAFTNVFSFRAPVSFHAQVVLEDGRGIMMGGISERPDGSPVAAGDVVFIRVIADGTLELASGAGLPGVFRHATAEVIGDRLFIIAGLGPRDAQELVYVSRLAGDTNEAWQAAPSLPEARTHHASLVHEGRIYIFGGFDVDRAPLTDILRSTHDDEGELTGWEVVGTWEDARWTPSGFVHDGHVYMVGGGQGVDAMALNFATVLRAEILPDGVGAFEEVDMPLPLGRSHVHQLPFVDGTIYSVGGRAGPLFTSTAAVHVGRLVAE